MIPIYVDSDNAIAARAGDVDDAFALAAILGGGVPVAAIGSVAGNTTEAQAFLSNRRTAEASGFTGPILSGTEAERFLATRSTPLRVVALGPLSNLSGALAQASAAASHWTEVVVVGGNLRTWGRWPPYWPFEFNLTKDLAAAHAVFACHAPLTIVPLDVASRLRVCRGRLDSLRRGAGGFLRCGSQRWLRRARRLKLQRSFPVWDLVAAMYVLEPRLFEAREASASLSSNGRVEWSDGRRVRIVVAFDQAEVWEAFRTTIVRESTASP